MDDISYLEDEMRIFLEHFTSTLVTIQNASDKIDENFFKEQSILLVQRSKGIDKIIDNIKYDKEIDDKLNQSIQSLAEKKILTVKQLNHDQQKLEKIFANVRNIVQQETKQININNSV